MKEKDTFPAGKKKMPLWAKIVLAAAAGLLLLLLCLGIAVYVMAGRTGTKAPQLPETTPPESQQMETTPDETQAPSMERDEITWEDVEQLENKDIINIMLIGQDARPGEDRARSDSMILVSINKTQKNIHLTSFMRDLYVQIPGYLDDRINVSYRYGGTELLNETLKQNFGVQVDGNAVVNFDQFQTIIDILGGIDVEMDAEEAWYMNDRLDLGPVEEGMNHLNGRQALGFARIRQITGDDFARTDRQRRIITSVAESLEDASVSEVMALLNRVLPYVSTDLTKSEIVSYLASAATITLGGGEMISGRIPTDDGYYPANIDGADVLVPYLDKCQEYLRDSVYQ